MKKLFLTLCLAALSSLTAQDTALTMITINNTDQFFTLHQKQGANSLILRDVQINPLGVDKNSILEPQSEPVYNFFVTPGQNSVAMMVPSTQGVEKTDTPVFFSIENSTRLLSPVRFNRLNQNNKPVIIINNTTPKALLLKLTLPKMNVVMQKRSFISPPIILEKPVELFHKIPPQQITLITRPDLSVELTTSEFQGTTTTLGNLQTLTASLTLIPADESNIIRPVNPEQPGPRFVNSGNFSYDITLPRATPNVAEFTIKSSEPFAVLTVAQNGRTTYTVDKFAFQPTSYENSQLP